MEKAAHSLLNYYSGLEAFKKPYRSPLAREFPGFFSQITSFRKTYQMLYKKFEGNYPPSKPPEKKHEMLAALHVLRYFVLEPDNRKEIARLFESECFRKVYHGFIEKNRPTMESFADTGSDIGIQLFHLLKNPHEVIKK
jgi:hypothetical protein